MHLLNNDKSVPYQFWIKQQAWTMWKISKRVQEVAFGTGALGSQLCCSRFKSNAVHLNGFFISHLVIRYSHVFSFTSGFWKQHTVNLGNRDKDARKHSQWSWNGPSRGYYRHLALPGKVFVWSLYVLVSCSLYPARFIAVLIALSVIAPAVFSLAVRNVSRNVLMLL